jgi:hypothetical protein
MTQKALADLILFLPRLLKFSARKGCLYLFHQLVAFLSIRLQVLNIPKRKLSLPCIDK